MEEMPKRRWLTFSVRTLLIAVTIFCVWLSWQVSIVRERKAVRKILQERETFTYEECHPGMPHLPGVHISWIRAALGDEAVSYFYLSGRETVDEMQRIRRAFPETVDGMGA